jgi:uncharacterized protein (TIGR03083 family)
VFVERDIYCGAWYERKRREVVALVRSLDTADLERIVPASPAWRVRDVLAHLIGITADLNAGHFGGDEMDMDAWTASQVVGRRDRTLDELVDEWDREAPRFVEGLRLLGYEIGSHFLADLLEHFADVLHALGRPTIATDEALVAALDFHLDQFHGRLATAACGARVVIVDGDERFDVGTGEPMASVGATRFELLRAFGGRRSRAQMRAFEWGGDVDAVLPHISAYGVPAHDLVDR